MYIHKFMNMKRLGATPAMCLLVVQSGNLFSPDDYLCLLVGLIPFKMATSYRLQDLVTSLAAFQHPLLSFVCVPVDAPSTAPNSESLNCPQFRGAIHSFPHLFSFKLI